MRMKASSRNPTRSSIARMGRVLCFSLLAGGLPSACAEAEGQDPAPQNDTLYALPASVNAEVSEQFQLGAQRVKGGEATNVSDKVSWTTSDPAVVTVDDPEDTGRVLLVLAVGKVKRFVAERAEPDIGEVAVLADGDPQGQVIERNTGGVVGVGPPLQHGDLEAERCQQGGEGAVQFVAESAPPLVDDLVNDGVDIQRDQAAEVDVEVLERHRQQVIPLQRTKCRQIDRRCPAIADPSKVGGDLFVFHWTLPFSAAVLIPVDAGRRR